MEVTKSNGKQKGREMMLALQKKREARSPDHLDPNWIHEFWRNRLQNYSKLRQVQIFIRRESIVWLPSPAPGQTSIPDRCEYAALTAIHPDR